MAETNSANIADLKKTQAALSPKAQQKQQVKHLIEGNSKELAKMMPKHMNADRLLKVVLTAVSTTPALLECYAPTLLGASIQLSQMGLEPNTVLGHAYLLPFNNNKQNRKEVQVIIGYKGLIDLARRSGQIVSIAAHAVYDNDEFEFEYGLDEKLKHKPSFGDRGNIKYFYAVAHMKDGGHAFEVMTRGDVEKIRDAGQGRNNPVWKQHFEQMGRKTAIRRLAKFLPLSVELAMAVDLDDKAAFGIPQGLDGVIEGEYETSLDDTEAQVAIDSTQVEKKGGSGGDGSYTGGSGGVPSDGSATAETSPVVTYAQAADAIAKAKDMDVLELAGDYINMVQDADQRTELHALYAEKEAGLKG